MARPVRQWRGAPPEESRAREPKGQSKQRQRRPETERFGREERERRGERFFKLERVEAAIEGNGRGCIDRAPHDSDPRLILLASPTRRGTTHDDSLEKNTGKFKNKMNK